MTALAADKKVDTKEGIFFSYLVKAAEQIYLGAMVVVDATTGYAYAGTNTSGRRFVGIATENVLGVTDGVERVKVRRVGVVRDLVAAGLSITDVGDSAWMTDDNTITTTPTNVLVGTIVAVPSATNPWVAIHHTPPAGAALTTLTVSSTCAVTGNATFGGTCAITGNTTVGGTLGVTGVVTTTTDCDVGGDVNCTGDLGGATATVSGNATVGGTCGITGNTTVGGTLGVTGIASFTVSPVIPTIVFGSLPSAAQAGQICFCATGDGGNAGLLITDGSNWLAMTDGATAAES